MTWLWAILMMGPQALALEWRANAGAEVNADPHAMLDVGLRHGPWSAELLTDTIDLRFAPNWKKGRAWAATRHEFGAAGLLISPWTNGQPDPSRAVLAFYSGVEGGSVHYLPGGLWLGEQAVLRYWHFVQKGAEGPAPPNATPVATGDAMAGWYLPDRLDAWVRAGTDWTPGTWMPHVHTKVAISAPWALSPGLIIHAGAAMNQDDLTRTRLGGLNPYVVPLAGAAWAEWWVENYAAAQPGLDWRKGNVSLGGFADVAWFDDNQMAVGLGARGRWSSGRAFAEGSGGVAPWVVRPQGRTAGSVFIRAGWQWGKGTRNATPGG
jgi:hypothetical protein